MIGTVSGDDADGDPITFNIEKINLSDPDFQIVHGTGNITFLGPELLNYDVMPK